MSCIKSSCIMALKSLPTRTTDTREAMHSPLPSCSIISGPLISLALEENNGNYKKHNKVKVVDQAFVFQTTIQSQSGSQMPSICLCRYCNKHSTPVSQFTVQVKPVFFQSLWINTQSKKPKSSQVYKCSHKHKFCYYIRAAVQE